MSKLKTLGLALIAVSAMSAAIASSAQASHVTCAEYPCVITGNQTVTHKFTAGELSVTCTTTKFDATVASAEKNERITVTPTYEGCIAQPGNLPATVTMNGCDYELYGGEEDVAGHFKNATTDIVCPKEKKIEVHAYQNATEHAAGKSVCTLTIPPQVGLHENTTQNNAGPPDDVTLVTNIAEIAVETHQILCGGTTNIKATYTGTTTLEAFKDAGTDPGPPVVYTEGSKIGLTISK